MQHTPHPKRHVAEELFEGEPQGLDATGFEEVRCLIRDAIGLDLKPGKEALVSARLGKRLRARGLQTVRELVEAAQADSTGERRAELIDDLTTNFTSFWREPDHFEYLVKEVAPQWKGRGRVDMWSAACSSGEEPYTLLCVLHHALGVAASQVRLLATDISRKALGVAQSGIYPADRVAALPHGWARRYFQQGSGQWEGRLRIKAELRAQIEFRRLNLMESLDALGPFAVIFCRNVLIYFDRATQAGLVERMEARLEPGGYLFLGHSEGMTGLTASLRSVAPSIWQKPGSAKALAGKEGAWKRWS